MRSMNRWISVATVFLSLSSGRAQAQSGLVPKEEIKLSEQRVLGWSRSGKFGLSASVSSSTNVVGQTDGSSQTYGFNLKVGQNFSSDFSDWQNSVTLKGATTRTPGQGRFVKSSDELRFESLYLKRLESMPKFGPYGKLLVHAPLFKGEDVRANPVNYKLTRLSGTTSQINNVSTLQLTDGLKPLTSRESVGAFWKPIEQNDVQIDVRLGVGAEQVNAQGQLAVTGANPDGTVGVKELKSLAQLGVEVGVSAKGKIDEKTLWTAGVEALTPFLTNKEDSDKRDAFRLTSYDGFAKLTANVTSWVAMSYDYKLLFQPLVVDQVQQTHLFTLNLNHDLF